MGPGRIERQAWSQVVARLLQKHAGGNKSAFSRMIGFTVRTIDRWLKREVDVTFESLYAVINRLKLDQGEEHAVMDELDLISPSRAEQAAMAAGSDERVYGPPPVPDPYDDPVISTILADKRWTETQRAELVQQQLDRMEADLNRRREEYERLLRLVGDDKQVS